MNTAKVEQSIFNLFFDDVSGNREGRATILLLGVIVGYIAIVSTISLIPSLGPYNEKRTLQIGVLVLSASYLVLSAQGRQRWLSVFLSLPFVARWLVCAVLTFGILSSAFAPSPFYALLEVGHFFLLFVGAGIVASAVHRHTETAERLLLGALAVSGLLYAVYFIVGYGMHLSIPDIKLWPEGGTNYANIRLFNQYQTWTLPLFAGIFLALPRRWRVSKGVIFGVISLWWALIFASNVRGTIVGILIAAIGVGLLFQARARNWLLIQVAGLLSGVALYYLLFSTGDPPCHGQIRAGKSQSPVALDDMPGDNVGPSASGCWPDALCLAAVPVYRASKPTQCTFPMAR